VTPPPLGDDDLAQEAEDTTRRHIEEILDKDNKDNQQK
jgi:hypothetical protein